MDTRPLDIMILLKEHYPQTTSRKEHWNNNSKAQPKHQHEIALGEVGELFFNTVLSSSGSPQSAMAMSLWIIPAPSCFISDNSKGYAILNPSLSQLD